MKTQNYRQLAQVEDRHWWYQGRLRLVRPWIDRLGLGPRSRLLDVGCGTGGTTAFLTRYGRVTGIDRSPVALHYARRKAPAARLMQADARQLGRLFAPASFDLVTFFNVLYHRWMVDERQVLAAAAQVLRPGGHLVLTEPAFRLLTRGMDVIDMGRARYTLADFRRWFREVGIEFQHGCYFNAVSLPAALALALRHRLAPFRFSDRSGNPETRLPPAAVNRALAACMEVERRLLARWPLPVGVTALAIGVRTV